MPRITTGTAKGRNLKTPNIEGFRAAQDKFKLAAFSILGEKVEEAFCLDLYAGSGSLGLGALSRGAKFCHFVDEHPSAERTIQENLIITELQEKGEVFRQDAVKFAANAQKIYDVVFIDPFYKDVNHKFLLQNVEEILNENGVIIFSHGKDLNIEEAISNTKHIKVFTQRKYGNARLTVLQ